MKIIDLSIRRRVTISMVTLAVVIFGFVAFERLEVTLLPDLTYPTLTVRTEYPGAAPIEVENLVSKPVEEAVGIVKNLIEVRSISRSGQSDVLLEFEWGTDMDIARLDVREKLDALDLPLEVKKPLVLRFDPSLDPILTMAVFKNDTSANKQKAGLRLASYSAQNGSTILDEAGLKYLRTLSEEQLKKELESIPGVAAVKISGGLEEEIQINIDQGKLDNKMHEIEVKQAKADIDKLENDFNRSKELFEKQLISKEEFQTVRFQYEAQKAAYDKAKLNLAYTSIQAPISGYVAERLIKTGNMVSLNQPVFKIVNFNPLIAKIYVPENDIQKIKIGQKAQLTLDATSGTIYEGEVLRISPIVNPENGTVKVTVAVFDKDHALKPGMFARVRIVYDTHDKSLLIPKHAVLSEDGSDMVFCIQDSIAVRHNVSTGYSDENFVEILQGLNMGDKVVVVGQNGLKDSARVEIIDSTLVADQQLSTN